MSTVLVRMDCANHPRPALRAVTIDVWPLPPSPPLPSKKPFPVPSPTSSLRPADRPGHTGRLNIHDTYLQKANMGRGPIFEYVLYCNCCMRSRRTEKNKASRPGCWDFLQHVFVLWKEPGDHFLSWPMLQTPFVLPLCFLQCHCSIYPLMDGG